MYISLPLTTLRPLVSAYIPTSLDFYDLNIRSSFVHWCSATENASLPLSVHPARFTNINVALLTYWMGYTIHHYHFSLDAQILPNLANLELPQNSSLNFPALTPESVISQKTTTAKALVPSRTECLRNHFQAPQVLKALARSLFLNPLGDQREGTDTCVPHTFVSARGTNTDIGHKYTCDFPLAPQLQFSIFLDLQFLLWQ